MRFGTLTFSFPWTDGNDYKTCYYFGAKCDKFNINNRSCRMNTSVCDRWFTRDDYTNCRQYRYGYIREK